MLLGAACATPEPAPGDPLSGTRWSLVSIGGSPALTSGSPSLQFEKGRASGSDGCNRYTTSYAASAGELKIGPNIAGTRMACAPAVMEEAGIFIAILGRTAGFRRDGDRLTLLERDGRPIAAFKKAP